MRQRSEARPAERLIAPCQTAKQTNAPGALQSLLRSFTHVQSSAFIVQKRGHQRDAGGECHVLAYCTTVRWSEGARIFLVRLRLFGGNLLEGAPPTRSASHDKCSWLQPTIYMLMLRSTAVSTLRLRSCERCNSHAPHHSSLFRLTRVRRGFLSALPPLSTEAMSIKAGLSEQPRVWEGARKPSDQRNFGRLNYDAESGEKWTDCTYSHRGRSPYSSR